MTKCHCHDKITAKNVSPLHALFTEKADLRGSESGFYLPPPFGGSF
jgi:hypothetical protein